MSEPPPTEREPQPDSQYPHPDTVTRESIVIDLGPSGVRIDQHWELEKLLDKYAGHSVRITIESRYPI